MSCLAKSDFDKEAARKNREIDRLLQQERQYEEENVKLLLLGTGGSGKSTVAKQMKIIHLSGFPEEELISFKVVVFNNVLSAIKTLLEEVEKRDMDINDKASATLITSLQGIEYSKEIADAVSLLWNNEPSIQEVFTKRSEFQLEDSAHYFLDNCQSFAEPDYMPNEIDVLLARAKTTGIVEINFVVSKKNFLLVDVGGQRNERKKWIHCFNEVTSIIYCAALNEYDMVMEEDGFTNRMRESLKVFGEVICYPGFINTPIILFLNKKDLFDEKIKTVDLVGCFPTYNGGLDAAKGSAYIQKKYVTKNTNKGRKVYPHFTVATDTKNVRNVFHDVQSMLVGQVLDDLNF